MALPIGTTPIVMLENGLINLLMRLGNMVRIVLLLFASYRPLAVIK